MFKLRNLSIRPRLIVLFLVVGLIPLVVGEWFNSNIAGDALREKAFNQLEAVQQSKKAQIEAYLAERLTDLEIMARSETSIAAMEHFHKIFHDVVNSNKGIGDNKWEKSLDQGQVQAIERFRNSYKYDDVAFIDYDGNVVYTAAREEDLGSNVTQGALKNSALHKLFVKAQTVKAIQDFEPYAPSGFRHVAFLGMPVVKEGQRLGVLVLQLPTATINAIMAARAGIGKTGENYLVGKHEGITSYRSDRPLHGSKIGQQKNAALFDDVLAGGAGKEIGLGPGGEVELHTYLPMDLPGLNWGMISAIDQDEVEEPIRHMERATLLVGGILAALVVGAAIFFSRTLANPLLAMSEAAGKIAKGDWSARVAVTGGDELGQLAVAFNHMAASNEEQFWVKSSLAKLTKVIQTSETPEGFAAGLIRKLTPLLGCGHGALYVLDDEKEHYRLLGGYGYTERKTLSNVFRPGEGLVGQCALEKEPILLTGVPGDHVKITTGLGESAPLSIMAVPLIFQDRVLAVMELGSFHPFTQSQKNLLEELIATLGLGLENLNRNQRTVFLLQRTQRQAEELEVQSEEMRQANEELQTQGEKIRLANEELQSRNEEVWRANEELEEQSQTLLQNQEELRTQQTALEQANHTLEKARQEVEQKAADLEAASRYKSQFLANMSHELRTPLNSLLILAKGFADNEDGNLTDEQVEAARIIHGSGHDLLELINDILDLSKIEAGKMDLHIATMDVFEFAQGIRTQFKHMARAKGLDWEVTVADGVPPTIETDAGKVRQIVKNFLSNAFKFTREGSVSVHFSPLERGGLTIAVADTGIGIPQDKHQLIFEAFQQADGGTSRKYGGTGLGLSIVRELARLLGGEIRLASEEGKGCVFSLLLPTGFNRKRRGDDPKFLTQPPDSPVKIPKDVVGVVQQMTQTAHSLTSSVDIFIEDDRTSLAKGDRLLLVIEDDPSFATIVAHQARKKGFKCLAAGTGESGMELAIRHRPMGIILDRGLPDMDGQALLVRLQENPITRPIPVHIISAMDGKESLGKGVIGVLEKPVTKEQLKKVMDLFACYGKDKKSKLLLVEDDAYSRLVTTNILENDGVQVLAANNCHEALAFLQQDTFDCMILDLSLPDCSGFDLLERISRDPLIRELPVVIHSGRELSREEFFRLRHYTDALVTKGSPGSGERLAKEVGAFLLNVETSQGEESPAESQDWLGIFKNRSVLLVDDDVRNTFALSRVLEKRGINVIMAPDGTTALELLEHSPRVVDAVLMDVMMPGMDGHEVTRRIREKKSFRNLPIIGLSAKAMEEDRQRSLDAGMNIFLSKPVDMEHLLGQLRDLLSQGADPQ